MSTVSLADGARCREIVDAMDDALLIHDLSGRVVEVNLGACALLGYPREELLKRTIGELSLESDEIDGPRAQELLARALRGESLRFDWCAKRGDGAALWVEIRVKPTELAGERYLLAVVSDITERRAEYERLRRIEQRYEAIARSLPDAAIIICDHDLRLVLLDGPEIGAGGFSKAEMEGRTIFETLPPDFVKLVEANMRRVLAGESFSAEIPFGELWYHYNYVPLRDDDGAVIYGMILGLNITERRRAVDRLRKSEERFAKIVSATPDFLAVTRLDDGRFVEVNPSIQALGWTREEVIGRTASSLSLWPDPSQMNALVDELTTMGRVDSASVRLRRGDGTIIDALVSLRQIEVDDQACVLTILRDVTDQRKTIRALEASEARLRGLAAATFEGVGVSESGRLIDVNEQLATMFGLPPHAMVGRSVEDFVAPESLEMVRSRARSTSTALYEHLAIRDDGTVFPVEVRPSVMVVDGRTLRVVAIRDVTAAKEAQREREQLISKLEARNAEMEQFTYSVSHDLKSPLVTINGFVGMLERDLTAGDAARVKADLARIDAATKKLLGLLDDLLELSRVGQAGGARSDVPLDGVVREALERVAGSVAERAARVVIKSPLPTVHGDRNRLVQVVQNLLENALKYMGNASTPTIEVSAQSDDTSVTCSVKDNGIGVDPRYAERIFALFDKLNPRSEGSGIGLALVRRIVEFHGGRVWCESDGAHGSTFFFTLPRSSRTRKRAPES